MKENSHLAEFYKGFISEFDIAFTAAQAVESGIIKF